MADILLTHPSIPCDFNFRGTFSLELYLTFFEHLPILLGINDFSGPSCPHTAPGWTSSSPSDSEMWTPWTQGGEGHASLLSQAVQGPSRQ